MEATTEHFHTEAKYSGHPDGGEDVPYRHLEDALGRAEENVDVLRPNGCLVEQTDTGNDDIGVIREYHVAEQDGTAVATIEVRTCHEDGHH